MATLDSVKAKLQNLLSKANSKTGRNDATLTPAVDALISGYGAGSGDITPTGTINITENGKHRVYDYEYAQVDVPVGITPSGTKNITANGTYDVTSFSSAKVEVPASGITPSGSINITSNGTYDVTEKASAVVNVPTPEQISVVRTVTISADVTGANNTYTLLSNDAFIKEHYAESGFSALWFLVTPVAGATGVIHFNYQGNRNIGSTTKAYTGIGIRSTSASAVGNAYMTANINGKGYAQHMRVDSSGNLLQYLSSGYILKAGTYQIILTCTT